MSKRIHKISFDQYQEFEEDFIGLCDNCGAERESTETDAENYPCDDCGANAVQGVGNLLVEGRLDLKRKH